DANNNVVLKQVEDRGNTSNVDGNPPSADLPPYITNPDPVGGMAFADTVYKYDILDQQVEVVQEVSNGGTPVCLRARYRYDLNGNLTIPINPPPNISTGTSETTTFLYDGFDRQVSTIDALGNQNYTQFDPAGNPVRVYSFGPLHGPSPSDNSAANFAQPLRLQ